MGKKILVVVDYQYDFFNPDGALYVNGGEKLQERIATIIPDFDHVIFTQDWHPFAHCSFKENGGIWPIHCVAGTIGAGIPVEFMKLAKSFSCHTKGENQDEEEYGAFDKTTYDLAVECDYEGRYVVDGEPAAKDVVEKVFEEIDEVVVCGIAGDYCVLETLKNIIRHIGSKKVRVFTDGIVSIDGGEKLKGFIKENALNTY